LKKRDRILFMKILFLAVLAVSFVVALIQGQHKMIYYPKPYTDLATLPDYVSRIEYSTSQGSQLSFYLPPASDPGKIPERLWFLFGGNASLALEWLDFLSDFPDPDAGFLLVDYPGYGGCQGRPGPDSILESSEQALSALAQHLKVESRELEERLNLMGHSLGAAIALLYGSRHPAARMVLISPFTSLKDMAARVVGKPLDRTLFHNYDNRARLKEVMAREKAPVVTILHGNHDKVVPVAMGRELAALSPQVTYHEIDKADHNYILVTAENLIYQAMGVQAQSSKSEIDEAGNDGT